MQVGQRVKVSLPGESPWAEVVEITDRGFKGRVDNKLLREYSEIEKAAFSKKFFGTVQKLPELHDYKYNDILEFAWCDKYSRYLTIAEIDKEKS